MNQPLRKSVALIVDHPQRDLAGLVLLARELCHRGVTSHLVPLNSQEGELWSLCPDFVLLNFTRHGTERLAQRLLEAGIDLGLLDTEGAIYAQETGPDGLPRTTFEKYTELLWSDRPLLKRVAVACMWSPRLAEHLAAGEWFTQEQLVLTGCPRFDFYHPRWRQVFAAGSAETPEMPRRILLNTWYALVNSQLVSADGNARQLRESYKWTEERIRQYFGAEQGAIRGFIELARRLSQDYPSLEIVLRPHPFESAATYRSGLVGFPNVNVDGSGPVQPQIFRASVLVARSCTTAVEAAMAGLPALSPLWIPTPYENPVSERASLGCADYATLKFHVDTILDGKYQRPPDLERAVESVLGDWFYRSDGLSYRRVADAIASRLSGPRHVDEDMCARFARDHESEQRRRRSRHHIVRDFFGLPPGWSFRRFRVVPSPLRTVKHFGVAEVEQLIRSLDLAPGVQDAAERSQLRVTSDTLAGHKGGTRPVTVTPLSAAVDSFPVRVTKARA